LKLILVGCEYSGKTTLAEEIVKWWKNLTGAHIPVHDHFTFPGKEQLTVEDTKLLMRLSPMAIELFQRYMIDYHLVHSFAEEDDHILVGYHIEEAVYAPLYYGYGYSNTTRDRSHYARYVENEILRSRPETVLVLLKASPETIKERMKNRPHDRGVVKEKDIELVLDKFEEQYNESLITKKFELDTTNATKEKTLEHFIENMIPHLRPVDSLRILQYQILKIE